MRLHTKRTGAEWLPPSSQQTKTQAHCPQVLRSMMVAPKRQKTVHGMIPVNMSANAMAKVLAWSGEGAIQVEACQERMRRLIDVKFDEFAASSTPYGKMIQQCQFPGAAS